MTYKTVSYIRPSVLCVKSNSKQECIPVGWVLDLTAAVPATRFSSRRFSVWRGFFVQGCVLPEGISVLRGISMSRWGSPYPLIPPSVDRQRLLKTLPSLAVGNNVGNYLQGIIAHCALEIDVSARDSYL